MLIGEVTVEITSAARPVNCSGMASALLLRVSMKALGVLLVALGILGLLYGGLSWTRKDKVVDAGPIEITADKTERIPVPPIAGGLILVAGIALLMKSGGSRA
jgi:uncharacterized membrane protein YidH (DUF202 family)